MKFLFIAFCLISFTFAANVQTNDGDYGGSVNNLPNWNSRALLTCLNWGRQDKDWFAEEILENEDVMKDSYYQDKLNPLYINSKIVTAAQRHATDMIEGDFLSSRGSDGSYPADRLSDAGYTNYNNLKTTNIGLAYLDGDSFLLCKFLFCEDGYGRVGTYCKADNNNPSLRKKAMFEDVNEAGAGYNFTTELEVWYRYKIDLEETNKQSFVQPEHPVVAGSHVFDYQANIKFILSYYESSNGEQPEWAAVAWQADGEWQVYRLVESGFGTYTYTGTRFTECLPYFFMVKDSKGNIWRYPEDQNLRTANWVGDEDTCAGLSTVPSDCDPTLDCEDKGACRADGVCACIDGWSGNTCNLCAGGGPSNDKDLVDQSVKTGESMTYIVDDATFSNDAENIYSAEQSNGQPLPEWLGFNPDTKNFTGTGADICSKTYTIKVIATDCGGSAYDTFSLELINDPPVFNSLDNQDADVSAEMEYQFAEGAFTDTSELTYTATMNDGSDLPEWLAFNSTTRTFTGTPPDTPVRGYTVKVTASDVCPLSTSGTFDIDVADSQPHVYTDLTDAQKQVLENWSYTIPDDAFSGGHLTYTASRSNGDMPTWIKFIKASKTFEIDNDEIPGICPETFNLVVTATNDVGNEENDFVFEVVNNPPVINKAIPDQTWTINTKKAYTFGSGDFTDPDKEDLSYTSNDLESWLQFSESEKKFSTDGADECGKFDVTMYIKDSCEANEIHTDFEIEIIADQIKQNSELDEVTVYAGEVFNFAVERTKFSQAQGLTLKFYADKPGWADFDDGNLQFSGTAPDSTSTTVVTLEAYTEKCGLSKVAKFNLIVGSNEGSNDLVSPANLISFSFLLLLIFISYLLF
ncbi:hypothetical protein M0813_03865 [Anaeramoeba flamelloides]|uniref:EGF-like domain-containing protein n=1 Tax=Anaeramoeba flamelloides TaxID=1746091 RepID=A0ABQ8XRD5_9EUKA|nr:hypothetical protein M0813_03865 [Anaeramoeba flamelloides]